MISVNSQILVGLLCKISWMFRHQEEAWVSVEALWMVKMVTILEDLNCLDSLPNPSKTSVFPQEVKGYLHQLLAGSSSNFKAKKCLETRRIKDMEAHLHLQMVSNTSSRIWEQCPRLGLPSGSNHKLWLAVMESAEVSTLANKLINKSCQCKILEVRNSSSLDSHHLLSHLGKHLSSSNKWEACLQLHHLSGKHPSPLLRSSNNPTSYLRTPLDQPALPAPEAWTASWATRPNKPSRLRTKKWHSKQN